MPNDHVAQNPPAIDHVDGEPKWHEAQGFLWNWCPDRTVPLPVNFDPLIRAAASPMIPPIGITAPKTVGRISVAQIHPAGAGGFEHALDLIKNRAEFDQVIIDRRFQTNLTFDTVIPQGPIRRRGHDAVYRLARETFELLQGVALQNDICLNGGFSWRASGWNRQWFSLVRAHQLRQTRVGWLARCAKSRGLVRKGRSAQGYGYACF